MTDTADPTPAPNPEHEPLTSEDQLPPRVVTILRDLADDYGIAGVRSAVEILWGPAPQPSTPARLDDRSTSQRAAMRYQRRDVARFRFGSIMGQVLAEFYWGRFTALEAARHAVGYPACSPHQVETARKRVSDLVRAGYLADSGERRQNEGSPDEATVWALTSKGRQALIRLTHDGWSKPKEVEPCAAQQ